MHVVNLNNRCPMRFFLVLACFSLSSCCSQDYQQFSVRLFRNTPNSFMVINDNTTVWRRPETDWKEFRREFRANKISDIKTSPLKFNGRLVTVSCHDNELLISSWPEGAVLSSHRAGWSRIMQTAAIWGISSNQFLLVVKGEATYKNYSKIHIFNSEFECVLERRIQGRSWYAAKDMRNPTAIYLISDYCYKDPCYIEISLNPVFNTIEK